MAVRFLVVVRGGVAFFFFSLLDSRLDLNEPCGDLETKLNGLVTPILV